ncbi:MAG TPA: molybdopterin-dependent oxidoreductase, partial [Solirubrobacter sp.]
MTTRGRDRAEAAILAAHEFFRRGEADAEGWSMLIGRGRAWEHAYRDRWRHDKVVRSTHGVNCTGSCSWNVYVKDGLITWESQAVDYPRTDPGRPDHEPRGCPRGASFSWYTYSPARLKHPYIRGSLLRRWRDARDAGEDAVAAFAAIAADGGHRGERGRGGFVRCTWEEAEELIAAATVHAIAEHGPDRVAGFTPIPAMSPVSFASGSRFISLIGGTMLTFYDWYADLPPASPQVFGDQTDVPESADWWDAGYLIVWGTNLPITRTPDAHFMTEARYRGQKVVVVSPDYSDHVKFADDWLPAQPGTDAALAMAMGHVILKEFWVDRPTDRFADYGRRFTDLPLLVALEERDGVHVPGRFLSAADLGDAGENADWKTVVLDGATGAPAVPNGAVGFRWGDEGAGRWNLRLGDIEPVLTLLGRQERAVEVALPRFDVGDGPGGAAMRRGVPAITVEGRLVTTVLDLMLATY